MTITRPPDKRIAYDIDGSQVGYYPSGGGARTLLSGAQKQALNDPINTNVVTVGSSVWWFWWFPQPMTMSGFWGTVDYSNPLSGVPNVTSWAYSLDSPDGQAGAWTHIDGSGSSVSQNSATWAAQGIQRSSATEPQFWQNAKVITPVEGVRAVRFHMSAGGTIDSRIRSAALYGRPTNPIGLEFWDSIDDEQADLEDVDWEIHDRSTSDTFPIRLKNTSSLHTFTGITVSLSDISGDSPAAGTNHRLSTDGSTWLTSISLPDLDPGEISDIFYVQRNTPSNAIIGPTGIYEVRLVPNFTGIS